MGAYGNPSIGSCETVPWDVMKPFRRNAVEPLHENAIKLVIELFPVMERVNVQKLPCF